MTETGDGNPLRPLLEGGDRRSIARSNEALKLVEAAPALVEQLAALANDADWLVSMRAVDLLEKVAHKHPEWAAPHKHLFIGPLADSDKWEIRLQVVRALPLFDWSPDEMRRVEDILRRDVDHPQKFVRAWAADSLSQLARGNPTLLSIVRRCVEAMERSGSKALAVQAKKIRERIANSE